MTWKPGDPWRLAASLVLLRSEIDRLWPDRAKASDGTIGDAAHLSRLSEHNPNDAGVVRAIDITHDPKHGPTGDNLAEQLRDIGRAGHPAPWYVVWNRRIASRTYGWVWRAYDGVDPHTSHVHVSVEPDPAAYDSTRKWGITRGDDDMPLTDDDVQKIVKATWAEPIKDPEHPGQTATARRLQYLAAAGTVRLSDLAGQIAAEIPGATQDVVEAALRKVLGSLDSLDA